MDQGYVHPAVEFVGGVFDRAHHFEAMARVQRQAGAVVGHDCRDDRLVAEALHRWIALVGRPTDVKIESRTGLFGFLWPALEISGWNRQWTIHGYSQRFETEPVLEAWRQAAKCTLNAG